MFRCINIILHKFHICQMKLHNALFLRITRYNKSLMHTYIFSIETTKIRRSSIKLYCLFAPLSRSSIQLLFCKCPPTSCLQRKLDEAFWLAASTKSPVWLRGKGRKTFISSCTEAGPGWGVRTLRGSPAPALLQIREDFQPESRAEK